MSVKRMKEKEKLRNLIDAAPRMRCRYCNIKDNCSRRVDKEMYENNGIMTRCLITPNRLKKKKSVYKLFIGMD